MSTKKSNAPSASRGDEGRELSRLMAESVDEYGPPAHIERAGYQRSLNVPWCDSPFLEEQMERENLSPELASTVRKYARDGYVVIDPQIPGEVLDATVEDMKGRYREGGGGNYASPGRIQDSFLFSRNSARIANDRNVLDLLYLLYRRQPVPFQTLNFPVGTEQKTHSDTIHFHSFPHHFMCGVWIALEDVDLGNGPLHYYPKSHRLPLYDMHDLGITAKAQRNPYEKYPLYESFVGALMQSSGLKREELQVKKGQALVWSANLFHGGSPIRQPGRTRNSQVTHYYFADCAYTSPLHSDFQSGYAFLRQVTNIKNGQTVPQYYNGQRIGNPGAWPSVLLNKCVDSQTEHRPLALGTTASHRIVAWPRWDEPEDLRRILAEFGARLARRADACLCLRFDRVTDRPLTEVTELVVRIYQETLGEAPLNVLLLDDDFPQVEWPRVGRAVTGAVRAGGPQTSAQSDFIAALGVPVFATGADLAAHLESPRSSHASALQVAP